MKQRKATNLQFSASVEQRICSSVSTSWRAGLRGLQKLTKTYIWEYMDVVVRDLASSLTLFSCVHDLCYVLLAIPKFFQVFLIPSCFFFLATRGGTDMSSLTNF